MSGTYLSDNLKPETKLYRTIPMARLYEMFAAHQNTLVRPKKWPDPFENLALQSMVNVNGELGDFGFKDDLYAQCWTTAAATDAIWQIFSNGTDGVRIRTTAGKLLRSLADHVPADTAPLCCFLGTVQYKTKKGLVRFSQDHFANGLGSDGKIIASSLLVKRRAFSHEKEVRLIHWRLNGSPKERDLFPYPIDLHSLIDQIMLHPQLKKPEADKLKAEIAKRTGFKGELKRSLLYGPPKGFQFIVGP